MKESEVGPGELVPYAPTMCIYYIISIWGCMFDYTWSGGVDQLNRVKRMSNAVLWHNINSDDAYPGARLIARSSIILHGTITILPPPGTNFYVNNIYILV
jgi:hypothetical protein